MRDFQLPGRSPVLASNGLCATSHPLAAEAAIDILRRGGNAMDAALAAGVLLGFCEPGSTGIGGDLFVLFSKAGKNDVLGLNASGQAPAAISSAALRAQGMTAIDPDSAHAVTLPGAVAGICALAERFGRIGLDAVLAPAIHHAEAGVPVSARAAFDHYRGSGRLKGGARKHYMVKGRPLRVGDIFRAPGQAEVLRRIARQGATTFYTGEVAADMLAVLHAMGGTHREADFAAVHPLDTTPISTTYKGTEVCEHPPNGQGATALLMLNMIKHFDLAGLDPFGAERTHLESEIAKLAHDARDRFIADPRFCDQSDHMLAESTAERLARIVAPDRVLKDAGQLCAPIHAAASTTPHRDTVYVAVVDRDRMAVSLIYSIFNTFGAGIASEKFGILLHNRGAGFTLEEGHPNELRPDSRPKHTIIPAMLRQNGQVTGPMGVMGGQYQPAGHVRVIVNMVDFGLDPQEALDGPRSFVEGGVLQLERGYDANTRARLAQFGHDVQVPDAPLGGGQIVRIDPRGFLEGASDPRKDGCAIGY